MEPGVLGVSRSTDRSALEDGRAADLARNDHVKRAYPRGSRRPPPLFVASRHISPSFFMGTRNRSVKAS